MHSRSCRDVFLNYLTLVKNDLLRDLKKQLELELSAINMQIISDLFSDCAVIDGHVCMIPVYTRTLQLSCWKSVLSPTLRFSFRHFLAVP